MDLPGARSYLRLEGQDLSASRVEPGIVVNPEQLERQVEGVR